MAPPSRNTARSWRKALRWLGRGVAVLLATALVLAGLAVAALHTSWGRAQLRAQVERAAQPLFVGKLAIGQIEGSIFTRLVVREATLEDAHGERAVAVAEASFDVSLVALASGLIHMRELTIRGVELRATQHPEGLNLATLLAPNDDPSAWDVRIDALRLEASNIRYQAAGEVVHIDDLAGTARASVVANGPIEASYRLAARWRERAVPLRIAGDVRLAQDLVTMQTLTAAIDEVELHATAVQIQAPRVGGQWRLIAPAASVQRLVPGFTLPGDVKLTADLQAGPDIVAVIAASVGTETLTGEARLDPAAMQLQASLASPKLNVQALVPAAPPTALAVSATFSLGLDPAQRGIQAVIGKLKAEARGRYGAQLVNEATVSLDVALANGRAEVGLAAQAPGATQARFDGVIEVDEAKTVRLAKATLVAGSSQIARAYVGLPPLAGTLSANLTLAGTLAPAPQLTVAGYVRGHGLRYGDTKMAGIKLDIHASGLPAAPHGKAHVVATGVTHQAEALGVFSLTADAASPGTVVVKARSTGASTRWRLDLDATIRTKPSQVDVRLGAHDLRLRGVRMHGQGGAVTVVPATSLVRVTDLATNIAGGTLHAHGKYHYDGRRDGGLVGELALRDIDLAQLDLVLGLGGALGGRAQLRAGVRQGAGGTYGTVAGGIDGLRVRPATPAVDVGIDATLAPRRLVVEGSVRGAELGRVAAMLEVRAPARLADVDAWQRLSRRDLTRGNLTVEALDLAVLAKLAGVVADPAQGPMAQPGGTVDGALTLAPAGSTGTLRAEGVTGLAMLPGPLGLDATISSGPDAAGRALLTFEAKAQVATLGAGRVAASVELPTRPFDVAAWLALDARALRGASVSAQDVVIDTALARSLGLTTPLAGTINVQVDIAAALASATAKLQVQNLNGGPLHAPLAATIDAAFDARSGLTVRLTSALATGQPLATASVDIKLPPSFVANLRVDAAAALLAAPMSAVVAMDAVPAQAIADMLGRPGRLRGTASLAAQLQGTLAVPVGEATLTLADIGTKRTAIKHLGAKLTVRERALALEVTSDQAHGGKLKLVARAPLANLSAVVGQMTATDFDLEPLTRLGPAAAVGVAGRLDADVLVAGTDPKTASFAGTLRLREGELPLHPLIGTLRDASLSIAAMNAKVVLSAEGRLGRGRVTLQGDADFAGMTPIAANAELKVDKVQVINEQQPIIGGTAKLALTRDGEVWRLKTTVRDGDVVVPEQLGQELHEIGVPGDLIFVKDGVPPPASAEPPASLAAIVGQRPLHPYLIVDVVLTTARVQTTEFRGAVGGTLTAYVGHDAISLDGAIETQRSDISLFDRRYRIERAAVRFDGSLDPLLDIELVHEFPELALYLMVGGRLSQPKLTLRSDPATYSEGQLFSILLGGQPGSDPGRGMRDAATALTSSFLSQKVTGYLDPYLPIDIDVLTYEPATGDGAAAVTIGKWLTSRLYVAYRRRVESRVDENSGEAQLEYLLWRRVMLEGVVGDRGVHGVDLLWTKRW